MAVRLRNFREYNKTGASSSKKQHRAKSVKQTKRHLNEPESEVITNQ